MNRIGGEQNWADRWYHSTDDGNPDFSRPMTHPEMVQMYWDTVDDNPEMLAELYVNFHQFDQVEFLIFKDRLSAAILVANSTRQAVAEQRAALEAKKKDGSHRVSGWEGESDMVLDEQLFIVDNGQGISNGASMLTAVSALESLFRDLAPDGDASRGGLTQLAKEFLRQHNAKSEDRDEILAMVAKVSKRRNAFAHTLTGSYWATEELEFKFDWPTLEDTLLTVGEIAIALERLVD